MALGLQSCASDIKRMVRHKSIYIPVAWVDQVQSVGSGTRKFKVDRICKQSLKVAQETETGFFLAFSSERSPLFQSLCSRDSDYESGYKCSVQLILFPGYFPARQFARKKVKQTVSKHWPLLQFNVFPQSFMAVLKRLLPNWCISVCDYTILWGCVQLKCGLVALSLGKVKAYISRANGVGLVEDVG